MFRIALLAVDVQKDFTDSCSGEQIAQRLAVVAEEVDLVIATRSLHPSDHFSFSEFGPHCVKGTAGARLNPLLDELVDVLTTRGDNNKPPDSYSGFDARTLRPLESLEDILKAEQVSNIVVGGLGHGWDVPQTAFDANALGYPTTVLLGAAKLSQATITKLERAGVKVNE